MQDTEKLLVEIKALRKTIQLQKKVIEIEIDKNKQVSKVSEDLSWYQNEISQLRKELSEKLTIKNEQQLSLESLIKSLINTLPAAKGIQEPLKDIIHEDINVEEYSEYQELKESDEVTSYNSQESINKEDIDKEKANIESNYLKQQKQSNCQTCGVKLDGELSCFSCGAEIIYS